LIQFVSLNRRVSVVTLSLVVCALCAGCTVDIEDAPIVDGGHDGPGASRGKPCTDPSECGSGYCEQGVCCETECTGTCRACNIATHIGVCTNVPDGTAPEPASQCRDEGRGSCRRDGKCNGAGACRNYPDGTICEDGACDGVSVVGAKLCEGGTCKAGTTTVLCTPFSCNPATRNCFTSCTSPEQCDGRPCAGGSCGKKALGATCTNGAECDSGSCADGVCCNLACTGACVSCNQPGKMGECRPVPEGAPDPRELCKPDSVESCGLSGLCNGQGGCAKYASTTECRPSSCSGGSMIPASTCDGNGTCVLGVAISCFPFICADGACKATCSSSSDCVAPNACANPGPTGSCGKKGLGQRCTARGECKSNNCVDGVCCDQACTGPCSWCALPNALGRCTPVPAGQDDPRDGCVDRTRASCSTNGRCNGARGCQNYPSGTVCRTGTCDTSTNRVTDEGVCRNGTCTSPAPTTCAPYRCNGARCGSSCSTNAQCSGTNVCVDGSCGKRPVGAVCSRSSECASNQCAQGVCCATACTASCFSCSLPGNIGTCTPVPAGGADPTNTCRDQGAASCGSDGTCNGTGGCKRYAPGTVCVAARCSAGTYTSESTCDGQGRCEAGSMRPCSPFVCNSGGTACFNSCTDNNQCIPTRMCQDGQCGRKEDGAACAEDDECASTHCVDGFCCNTTCTGVCRSCALTGKRGTCSDIPDDVVDDDGGCPASEEASCGNDGKCNGAGACRKWGTSVQCRAASCPPTQATLTRAANCDGRGSCPPGDTQSCGNYRCDTNDMCRTSCSSNADCNGKACDLATGTCGKNLLGDQCSSNDDCDSNHCVDKTCCSTASCSTCQSCANSAGTCAYVPDGMTDPDSCSDSMNPCGTTGRCDGSGQCRFAGSGTECGQTCSADNTAVVARTCNGGGQCTGMGTAKSCQGFLCVQDMCATSCDGIGCAPGKVCVNNSCEDPAPTPDAGP
jgi:hypothetical protein